MLSAVVFRLLDFIDTRMSTEKERMLYYMNYVIELFLLILSWYVSCGSSVACIKIVLAFLLCSSFGTQIIFDIYLISVSFF